MSIESYLILANSVVWLGLVAYLVFLTVSASRLKKRERQLELLEGEHE